MLYGRSDPRGGRLAQRLACRTGKQRQLLCQARARPEREFQLMLIHRDRHRGNRGGRRVPWLRRQVGERRPEDHHPHEERRHADPGGHMDPLGTTLVSAAFTPGSRYTTPDFVGGTRRCRRSRLPRSRRPSGSRPTSPWRSLTRCRTILAVGQGAVCRPICLPRKT